MVNLRKLAKTYIGLVYDKIFADDACHLSDTVRIFVIGDLLD